MSKKSLFTTITPLPAGVSRETVMETLHDHLEMIDLNPSHQERHRIKPPPEASPEEYHCTWYQVTDKVSYLPANMYTGTVSFNACFHDLPYGLQTHVYAPMGLDIKEKWSLGGSLPGEPVQPVEIGLGVPISGLYLREDVELKCNFLLTKFVKKTLKQSLETLVARLVVKAQLAEAAAANRRLTYDPSSNFAPPMSPILSPPTSPPAVPASMQNGFPNQNKWQEVRAPLASPRLIPATYQTQFPEQHQQQYPNQYPQRSTANELDSMPQSPPPPGQQGPGRTNQPRRYSPQQDFHPVELP